MINYSKYREILKYDKTILQFEDDIRSKYCDIR